jgi:antitoxin (DNA-binding transcriptional repressor) of toxin-antitoxin stability system
MISLELSDAQRDLPTLVNKALQGEQVFITVGQNTLRLAPADAREGVAPFRRREGRGRWKGRVTIPDTFYEPWTSEETGEQEG